VLSHGNEPFEAAPGEANVAFARAHDVLMDFIHLA